MGACWAGPTPAHPRTRGEHSGPRPGSTSGPGSSPHTRGTRDGEERHGVDFRLIPAHAGNTARGVAPGAPGPAHPRTRGEHAPVNGDVPVEVGSSPHTRGTPGDVHRDPAKDRLIPAHAGNTRLPVTVEARNPAHPRTRGEHAEEVAKNGGTHGSSPHTRGTRKDRDRQRRACRLIPAHAGNTHRGRGRWPRRSAHPRTRGEHHLSEPEPYPGPGSSPHTRGTRAGGRRRPRAARLIPAHAGNTFGVVSGIRHPPAHPRTRGEHA